MELWVRESLSISGRLSKVDFLSATPYILAGPLPFHILPSENSIPALSKASFLTSCSPTWLSKTL